MGKEIVIIDNGKDKAQNVLYVDGLKKIILRKMVDRGYDLIFQSKICKLAFAPDVAKKTP